MASGSSKEVGVEDYEECPICRDCLKSPRTLECGHYFCTLCLEGIVRENPESFIKCPTCREVTEVPQGSKVTDLPLHDGKYCLQDQVSEFLARAKHREVTRYCGICEDKNVISTGFCYRCTKNLCHECLEQHERRFPTHNCVPVSDFMFCVSHVNEIVIDHCKDCKKGICCFCAFKEHANHPTVDINDASKESRDRLNEFLKTQNATKRNEITLKGIKTKLASAREQESEFNDYVTNMRKLIKELEAKLDQVELETKRKLAAEIKTLVLYESDIQDLITSTQSLVDHAVYLTEKASDPELVEQEKHFPMRPVSHLQNIDKASVELPVLDNTFITISDQLQQMALDCKVEFKKWKIGNKNIEEFIKQHTISAGHDTYGITFDVSRRRLIARTTDTSGPLKVYNYQGQLQESLGAGVNGLADCSNWRSICIDTKRDCYMAPCQNLLVLVDRAGRHIKSIAVGGAYNCGVAYDKDGDNYLVSDFTTHSVYQIDANTSLATRLIGSGSLGFGPNTFNQPYNIYVEIVPGTGSSCIIVSDWGNHGLKLYNMAGRHLKTLGSPVSGDGQLRCPGGITTDPNGQVIICDQGNRRIACYWSDGEGDHWECLLQDDWGGNQPWRLALDTDNMVMAVVDHTFQTIYIYE